MPADKRGQIGRTILPSVSRSFYLSIRILPKRLREPIALAYLLARSTDTVADTGNVDKLMRAETLEKLSSMIQGKSAASGIADLVASFASRQTNPSERKLLESLPECLQSLESLSADDRNDVREALDKITQGQALDLQRFDNPSAIRTLDAAADLDQYTYLVAGCVGEFWTRLCFRHLRKFAALSEVEMLGLGKSYGMGLQLINILRDAGTDLRAGRCYFPKDELAAAAMTPLQILSEPERFQPIYRNWIDQAANGLESGMQYSRAICRWRVRAATVLPALIGARTISFLRQAGATALHQRLKVPRREVRRMILSLVLSLASRKQIDLLFRCAKR
jgi:farnesyl-diphosphate farnesyltransferase